MAVGRVAPEARNASMTARPPRSVMSLCISISISIGSRPNCLIVCR